MVDASTGTTRRLIRRARGTCRTVAFWCEHAGVGIANDCAGLRLNGVRYDTPTFAGFSLGASWGEDDYWDIAMRYNGEHSGFKLAFATAYSEAHRQHLFRQPTLSTSRSAA